LTHISRVAFCYQPDKSGSQVKVSTKR
jgi:hypothetical protein